MPKTTAERYLLRCIDSRGDEIGQISTTAIDFTASARAAHQVGGARVWQARCDRKAPNAPALPPERGGDKLDKAYQRSWNDLKPSLLWPPSRYHVRRAYLESKIVLRGQHHNMATEQGPRRQCVPEQISMSSAWYWRLLQRPVSCWTWSYTAGVLLVKRRRPSRQDSQ